MRRLAFALAMVTLLLTALAGAQGDTVVTSASVRVIRRPVAAVLVSVTNRASRPITAIDIAVDGTEAFFRFTEHRAGAAPVSNATILSQETRTLIVRIRDEQSGATTASVTTVTFEDGRVEGAASAVGAHAVSSVAVTSTVGVATDIVAVIENLRAVPMRAWRIDELQNGQPATSNTSYLCPASGNGANGLIRPREIREITWGSAENQAVGITSTLTLTGALWEDQKIEGSAAVRAEFAQMQARSSCR